MKRTLLLTSILCFLFMGMVWSQTASSSSSDKGLTAYNSTRSTNQNPKVKVYPNPATHYIKLSKAKNVSKIKILSLIGSPIKLYEVMAAEEKYDVATLPNGLYLVQLLDAQNKVITTERLNKR
ncbi:MAG: T9SS type A sorting domain-containing protein [Saprospiraceae bacterium]